MSPILRTLTLVAFLPYLAWELLQRPAFTGVPDDPRVAAAVCAHRR